MYEMGGNSFNKKPRFFLKNHGFLYAINCNRAYEKSGMFMVVWAGFVSTIISPFRIE